MLEEHKNVPPMEQRRLVTYINHFIMSTVTFLNNFMTHCETKMMKSEQRLQNISASLCILETKLNSVPDLQELEPEKIPTSDLPIIQLEDSSNNTKTIEPNNKTEDNVSKLVEPNKTEDNVTKLVEPVIVEENHKEANVDPTILKYRKMLQFGVPRAAVELKMVHEGLDPKLL